MMRHDRPSRSRVAAPAGFTLVEVLVALVVLALGALGLAALQASGARLGYAAYVRSLATIANAELIDRMRMRVTLNPTEAADILARYAAGAAASCDPTGAAAEREANDLACWRNRIAGALPGGDGEVAVGANGLVTLTVRWQEPGEDAPKTLSWTVAVTALQ